MINTSPAFDFDTVIDRRRTNSVKWDFCDCCEGEDDILPMWVADMDFSAPPAVVEAIRTVAGHGIYGYSAMPDSYYEAIESWCGRRYGYRVSRDQLSYTPGVITGLNMVIQAFTNPGDGVVITPPVYPPFFSSVRSNGRRLVEIPLSLQPDGYRIDFDHLESRIDAGTKLLVLCSPHNPVGRVWSRGELERLAEIALRHGLLIFSDEIHADIVYPGAEHTVLASLAPEVADITFTGIAPSKTFNIAGLKASVIVTANQRRRHDFDAIQAAGFGLYNANIFAIRALEVAYREGEPWLEALLAYLVKNLAFAVDFITRELPGVRVVAPQGTFLLWLDFSELGLEQEQLRQLVFCNAKVGLNDGLSFGESGCCHMRLNFGCARSVLREGLMRLKEVLI